MYIALYMHANMYTSTYMYKSCAHVCDVVTSSGVVDTGWSSVATNKTTSQNIASRTVIIFRRLFKTVTARLHSVGASLDHSISQAPCIRHV